MEATKPEEVPVEEVKEKHVELNEGNDKTVE
jgi:superfamily II DNA/RNA helicase